MEKKVKNKSKQLAKVCGTCINAQWEKTASGSACLTKSGNCAKAQDLLNLVLAVPKAPCISESSGPWIKRIWPDYRATTCPFYTPKDEE